MTLSKRLPQRVMGESTGNVHIQMYNYPALIIIIIIVIVIIIIIAFYKLTNVYTSTMSSPIFVLYKLSSWNKRIVSAK